ncbi:MULTISPECIES: hypothetical protein [unclassified Saccharibacter]|uniref:hypothetical protein n=1 Tax=unclassified Saccharibacter TaxID=2648722 RepID=UPI0013542A00|nr:MULTISPECIES: hypothetical protein [unclassified Saccharibacter]MXV58400.1 hypothetical protein [Saccharibacter sp. EH70]MXV65846.1 hypothetical protein [Saccharibacter sp. EH60]
MSINARTECPDYDTLSEQARLDLLKFATQTVIDHSPSDKITHETMEGFYSFLCRLARGEDLRSEVSSHKETDEDKYEDRTETREEVVAQTAFELSVGELLQIIKGFPSAALKERAIYELKRRCGEGESVHVKERV